MGTADELIESAFERHQAGDLDKAEALYHEALSAEPDSLNGLQLLGLLIHQRGRTVEAITLLNQPSRCWKGEPKRRRSDMLRSTTTWATSFGRPAAPRRR